MEDKDSEQFDIMDLMNQAVGFPGLPVSEEKIEFRNFYIIFRKFCRDGVEYRTCCVQCISPDEVDLQILESMRDEAACPDHHFCICIGEHPDADRFGEYCRYSSGFSQSEAFNIATLWINRYHNTRMCFFGRKG